MKKQRMSREEDEEKSWSIVRKRDDSHDGGDGGRIELLPFIDEPSHTHPFPFQVARCLNDDEKKSILKHPPSHPPTLVSSFSFLFSENSNTDLSVRCVCLLWIELFCSGTVLF